MKKRRSFRDHDVIIVGARCAGAATALMLAKAGAKVLMIDRAREIGDTLSTHALMRGGVTMLHRLGVLNRIMAAETPVIDRTRFNYGPECIDIKIKPVGEIRGLCAPRRYVLDRILSEAAVMAGAELRTGVTFETLTFDGAGWANGARLLLGSGQIEEVSADLVIGADGRLSAVAKAANARQTARSDDQAASVYGHFTGVPNEGYRWYFEPGLQAGLIPTTSGQHCVFVSCPRADFQKRLGADGLNAIARTLSVWEPEIAATLLETGPVERLYRFAGAPGHIRDCHGPGWALVGDAGYFKDPATAHGITDALLDAHRLASTCLASPGDLGGYQRARDAHAKEFFEITQTIASLDWTFDELKDLHGRLNLCMNDELENIDATSPSPGRRNGPPSEHSFQRIAARVA